MAFSAKATNCVRSVVRLSDDEVAEVLNLSDRLQEADPSLSADAATAAAVRQLIDELRNQERKPDVATPAPAPVAPAEPVTPLGGLAASLTGKNPTKAITDRIAAENKGGFETKVDAARAAGDITKNQADTLKEMAASDDRGMTKAKDELMRLREKASERKTNEREAGKAWMDPDFSYTEGDPKWSELSPAQRTRWTEAVAANKANGELYEQIVAEHAQVKALPTTNTDEDIQTVQGLPDANVKAVDKTNAALKFGDRAATWLAENGSTPFIREVARVIAPFLGKETVVRFDLEGAPSSVLKHVQDGAAGVSSLKPDGSVSIYFRPDLDINESDLLHELVHAATQKGILVASDRPLVTELSILTKTIQRGMVGIYGDTADPAAKQFAGVVDNPHELIAYAFSSEAFRNLLKQFKANGERISNADLDERAAVERDAERDAGTPPERTLWQRFTDFVRRLLGVPEKHKIALDQLLANREAAKQAYIVANTPTDLFTRLDSLLGRVLMQQTNTDVRALPRAMATARDGVAAPVKKLPTTTSIPDFEPGNKFATTLKDWTGGWKTKPGMLGWMTLRQLGDRFKDVPGVAKFTDLSARMGAKAKSLMTEAHRIDQEWAKLEREDMLEMQRLMLETTMEQIWPNRNWDSHTHLDLQSPQLKAKHAAFAKRYNALSENARRTYEQAQAKMKKDWDERGRLLKLRVTDQYRAELHHEFPGDKLDHAANANKGDRKTLLKGLNKAAERSLSSMFSDLDTHAETLAQMQGPYFPLMRFGEHVVVAKSTDLREAQDTLSDLQDTLDSLNADDDTTEEQLVEARKKVKSAKAEVDGFKDTEKHYIVEFYESPSEARARQKQLVDHFAAAGQAMGVYTERREEHFARLDTISPGFMKKLESSITSALPDKDANAIRMAVRDLYIQSMPERSALRSQLKRIGVKGVKDGEMRRGFAAASMRNSWHLSRLEFGQDMTTVLGDLRRGESDDERIIGTEFAKRMASTFQQDTSSLLTDRLSNLSYLTYLGLSPSFFVINAMQPWTISLPIMAGRFGMKRSTVELGKAFNEVGAAMVASAKDQKTWRFELNLDEFKDQNERRMLETLFNNGVIDVTIEHDLGSLASGKETGQFGKLMNMASLPAHHTEVVNRVMTALAAYRLQASGGLGERSTHDQATKYAEQIVADTHLDYTPENAPRFMRSASLGGLGRIVFQFKKYMQGMAFLWGKLGKDAFKGDKEAQRSLMYLTGMQFAVSGGMGLPFAAPISLVAAAITKMYPDDDQPEYFQLIYRGMKDAIGETAARALMKGLPAAIGADLSGRLAQNFNPLAFVPPGKEGSDYVSAAVMALAGPAVSMMANWAQAVVVAKDDPMKAAGMALPKFMADPIRAIDRADRGVTNKRGDTLISPDEFGPMGILMRSIGFEQTDVSDMYDTRGAFLDARHGRDTVRARLLRQAVQDRGDPAVAERISEFNERHPAAGERITGKVIQAAAKSEKVTAASLREGVAIRKNDRALAERLGVGQ